VCGKKVLNKLLRYHHIRMVASQHTIEEHTLTVLDDVIEGLDAAHQPNPSSILSELASKLKFGEDLLHISPLYAALYVYWKSYVGRDGSELPSKSGMLRALLEIRDRDYSSESSEEMSS